MKPESWISVELHLECSTGMEHLVRMLPMMMASLSVHVPDSHSGSRIPENTHDSSTAHGHSTLHQTPQSVAWFPV